VEAFPNGGWYQFPPQNVVRRKQMFEIWIRSVPHTARLFALRCALREFARFSEKGLTREEFEKVRGFLRSYRHHYATSTMARLGFRMDDGFHGVTGGYLENFQARMDALTLDQVNAAIRRHLRGRPMTVAMVTNEGEAVRKAILANASSPITYPTTKSTEVQAQDREIEKYPFDATTVTVVDGRTIFEK
jgi:zinc protease